MGYLAEKIALTELGKIINGIFDKSPVQDPHIMVMAIGDAFEDQAPLQVTQFESDVRIVEQLTSLYLEGNGGGNGSEGYDVPWYFAAKRTAVDSFDKRGKRGYIFTMGDEPPPPKGLTNKELKRIFGEGVEESYISSADMLRLAQEKYNVFHIVVEEGSNCSYKSSRDKTVNDWDKLLGKKTLLLKNSDYLAEVILATMMINEGKEPEEVFASFENARAVEQIKYSIRYSE
jgi:hypothetical protein